MTALAGEDVTILCEIENLGKLSNTLQLAHGYFQVTLILDQEPVL